MKHVLFASSGSMRAPGFVLGFPTRRAVRIANVVGVCVRDDDSILLIDVGWSAETCANPARLRALTRWTLGVSVSPSDSLVSQLNRAGYSIDQVTSIVATHLHHDHIDALDDFPNARLTVLEAELRAARQGSRLRGYEPSLLRSLTAPRIVSLESKSYLGFPRSLELEPGVRLVESSGHTAGSTSVAVEVGDKVFIHAGDSAYSHTELEGDLLCPFSRLLAVDPHALRLAQRRLRACARDYLGVQVVLTHDDEAFQCLPHLENRKA